jgi:hypothetical protein
VNDVTHKAMCAEQAGVLFLLFFLLGHFFANFRSYSAAD